ncbi:MAG: hypothetical protein Unbinned5179contig1001_47 [Prokaryotic dsDNA virus sp.]|nr:MAG: hypothetical protein Unbinned5179contig1001_47 [Prokaryotic dsDNA virus sp.]|tara:strand:+ start:23379 stop:25256 length:1878 start_codon:yes stop_codon:yes gene_type:complete
MAKITRSKLARGAKLLKEHVFDPMISAQSQATSANIESDQRSGPYAPFRINLSVPFLDRLSNKTASEIPDFVTGHSNGPFHAIPFMLPPFQEQLSFSTSGARGGRAVQVSDSMPEVVLDEISFSFDQRLEPAAIVSNWDGAPTGDDGEGIYQGLTSYERSDRLTIDLAVMEKMPTWFEGTPNPTNFLPGRVVWSGRINALDVQDGFFRLNPWVSSSINEVIDPFKTYVFTISAPNLGTGPISDVAARTDVTLVSIEVSLKFLTKLTARDSGTRIQNIPKRHDGLPNDNMTLVERLVTTGAGQNSATARPLINTPGMAVGPGNPISANNATVGVQTSMAVIDEMSRRKFQGGYKLDSDLPMIEELKDTAAYTVIAVPLFNNMQFGGLCAQDFGDMPYIGSTGANKFAIDRRYIPIESPMTIHHVLFTYSWMPFYRKQSGGAGGPQSIDGLPYNTPGAAYTPMQLTVGVGIGMGMRGDSFGYQQVAGPKTIQAPGTPSWYGAAVDLIQHGQPETLPQTGESADWNAGTRNPWNIELHAMDLVGTGSPSLNGMTSQGEPVFVGRGSSTTGSRQNIAGAPSAVAGGEQWIEVRAKLGDPTLSPGSYDATSMMVGAGGIWVYIIGKTHLV